MSHRRRRVRDGRAEHARAGIPRPGRLGLRAAPLVVAPGVNDHPAPHEVADAQAVHHPRGRATHATGGIGCEVAKVARMAGARGRRSAVRVPCWVVVAAHAGAPVGGVSKLVNVEAVQAVVAKVVVLHHPVNGDAHRVVVHVRKGNRAALVANNGDGRRLHPSYHEWEFFFRTRVRKVKRRRRCRRRAGWTFGTRSRGARKSWSCPRGR